MGKTKSKLSVKSHFWSLTNNQIKEWYNASCWFKEKKGIFLKYKLQRVINKVCKLEDIHLLCMRLTHEKRLNKIKCDELKKISCKLESIGIYRLQNY